MQPQQNDVDVLVRALDDDGDGYITLEEFVTWVVAGLALGSQQTQLFAAKGSTEAVLVHFLQSLRADVQGIMNRVASSVRTYGRHGGSETTLDARGFAAMMSSAAKDVDDVSFLNLKTLLYSY